MHKLQKVQGHKDIHTEIKPEIQTELEVVEGLPMLCKIATKNFKGPLKMYI